MKTSALCILVSSGPGSEDGPTLLKISEAAMAAGHRVRIFLMCDAVYHLLNPDLLSLLSLGAEITVCAHNAMERGVEKKAGVVFGSQYDLAEMVAESQGFLALT